ncbi:unnamed protein product, partial [Mesorhabditis spiculigera]
MNLVSQEIQRRLDLTTIPPQRIDGKDAAILVLLRGQEIAKLEVLLCVRSMNMRKHPGEVCFPGGMWEPQDSDLQQTALREAHEETGLGLDHFELLGSLPSFRSRFGVLVHPAVALWRNGAPWEPQLNSAEVEKVFWQPLHDFLDKSMHSSYVWDNVYTVHSFDFAEAHCYGFTAFIAVVVAMCAFDRVPDFDLSEAFTAEIMRSVGTKSVVAAIFSVAALPADQRNAHIRLNKL